MKNKRIAKVDLPAKTCAVCQRPFVWRKKWSRVWEDVRYCSDACRRQRNSAPSANNGARRGMSHGGRGEVSS